MRSVGNPASLLHNLLSQLLDPSTHGGKLDRQMRSRDAWANVFGLDPDDHTGLLEAYASVITLPRKIRAGVMKLEGENHALLMRHIPSIEDALVSLALHSNLASYVKRLRPEVMQSLEVVADAFDRHGHQELSIPAADLEDVHERISELFEDVRVAVDIDEDLRSFILTHLSEIERSIRLYQIEGAGSLQDAFDRYLGHSIREAMKEDDHIDFDHSLVIRLKEIMWRCGQLVQFVVASGQLGEWITQQNILGP